MVATWKTLCDDRPVSDAPRIFRGTPEAEAARRAHEAALAAPRGTATIDAGELRRLCRDAGADDVGFVEIDRPGLGPESDNARRLFPRTRTLISFVTVSNPDAIRSVSRAVANEAWHDNHRRADDVADRIVTALTRRGIGAVGTALGFPMETRTEPGAKPWEIEHKVVAVEAGLGHMGVHRNVIHPRFGSFVLLETVLIDAVVTEHDRPIEFNPCNDCNLCVVACPVGAVRRNDDFDFFACLTHNYREFLFGFEDWIHTIAAAPDAAAYTSKFPYEETRSFWQSLGFGPKYKAAYCQAVCPAGDEVVGPYMADRVAWRREVVEPFKDKHEYVYVTSGSRAEKVARRNPNKRIRYVDYRVDVSTPENFAIGLRHRFDPALGGGVRCVVRFAFPDGETLTAEVDGGVLRTGDLTGSEPEATVRFTVDDYIRFLHADPVATGSGPARHELGGDPAALAALLATLA